MHMTGYGWRIYRMERGLKNSEAEMYTKGSSSKAIEKERAH